MNDIKSAFRLRLKTFGSAVALKLMLQLCIAPVFALCACTLGAQTSNGSSADIPPANELIARHLAAIHGVEGLRKRLSYHLSGRFELPEQKNTGTLEIFGKQPDKVWIKVEIPKGGKYLRATDGSTMWQFNPQNGYRARENWEYHAKQGLKRRDDEQQHRLMEALSFFSTWQGDGEAAATGTVRRASFNGHLCFERQFGRRNQLVREFFDTHSGFRVGATYPGTNAETFFIDGYREFRGLKIATQITRLSKGKTNDVFVIDSAEFVDVPDSRFALPIHLPEFPEGWNQIDEGYPPGFAKETLPWPWKGEHNRWFSPGFGRTNDAFFWSYAVLNALEGDTLRSAAELEDALHRYDASLYGKAFPAEKIKVAVGMATTEDKLGHEVTRRIVVIDGFDAESSKQQLRTYVESFRWYCPTVDRTAFLILRSPRPYDPKDEVWKVLQRFRDELVCHHELRAEAASSVSSGVEQP